MQGQHLYELRFRLASGHVVVAQGIQLVLWHVYLARFDKDILGTMCLHVAQ